MDALAIGVILVNLAVEGVVWCDYDFVRGEHLLKKKSRNQVQTLKEK